MATEAGKIVYQIDADTSGIGSSLKQAETSVKSFSQKIKDSLDSQAGSFFKAQLSYDGLKTSLKAVGGFLADSVNESLASARQWSLVQQNIENAGLAYDQLKPKIEAVADASIELGFDDEDTATSLSKLVLVTKDYDKALSLLKLSQDLSANKGIDIASATKAVTMATQGNTKVLKEYGIEVTDAMSTSEALALAYDKVKGSAQATVNPIDVLTNKYANIKQAVGDQLTPTLKGLGEELNANSKQLTDMAVIAGNAFAIILKGALWIGKGVLGAFKIVGSGIDSAISSVLNASATATSLLEKVGIVSDGTSASIRKMADDFKGASDVLAEEALDVFAKTADTLDDTTKSAKDTAVSFKGIGGASQDSIQGAKDSVNAFKDFQKSLLDTRDKARDLAETLKTKLSDGFKQFKEDLSGLVKDGATSLAEIVVKADAELVDKKKELAEEMKKTGEDQSAERIKTLQDEINASQKILTQSTNFQLDLKAQIAEKQKGIDELNKKATEETDPIKKAVLQTEIEARTSALEQTRNLGDLDKTIAEARKDAQLNEFELFEKNLFKQIDEKTNAFVLEVTQIREKLEITNQAEADITAFYQQQTTLRQATVDAFATATVARLKAVGAEAKSAMEALNALQSMQARGGGSAGGKAMGGFTSGGEMVHGGEYVIPRSMVRALPNLVNQLEGARTGSGMGGSSTTNAPITINAQIDSSLDVRTVGRELAWELSKK